MKYYEIKNEKTQENAQVTAATFSLACKAQGWRPQDCKCIWKASIENKCNPAQY